MDKNLVAVIGEQVGEVAIGSTIGIVGGNYIVSHCNTTIEKVVVAGGSIIAGFPAGKVWAKHYTEFVNDMFGTDLRMDGARIYYWKRKQKKEEP